MKYKDAYSEFEKESRKLIVKSLLVFILFWSLIAGGVVWLIKSNGGIDEILINTGVKFNEIAGEIESRSKESEKEK